MDACVYPVLFLLLFPTWAWKPVLMALTERREPQDSHDMKKIRFSFVKRVSADRQRAQVTYSSERQVISKQPADEEKE
jgi:hypothetical protein